MHPDNVLQKTAKGREEIEKRTQRIDPKRRTLLIMVDGRSSAAAIAEKAAHIADGLGLLQSLLTDGFVEPAGEVRADAAAPVPQSGRTLDELKRAATGAIGKLMGPDGDTLALKLERARTPEAFFAEAAKAREALRSFLGPRQAEEFWKSVSD